jgi:hypothetical protein
MSRGSDHPRAVRSANVKRVCEPAFSSQLNTTPPADVVSCGCALAGPTGDSIRSTRGVQSAAYGARRPHAVPKKTNARTATPTEHCLALHA